ncbi:hypothetical protein A5733_10670 [Mycobacterium sp. NS-7484]|uniref:DUF732 domain-containing protein n=1 Tax=unclassified Mycobacterium TaxID=2642494 RepID=UPI000800D73C|nr:MULTISPECIES: DUF732 domain-containing protein [unclassified Mycobacterium]OBG85288.1 hypothetical protein A5699_24570 [Mycobacterium sp. E802]OMB97207.1 hypothetical protein A5733_10670 [Mycobacterium sp. NS-7484]
MSSGRLSIRVTATAICAAAMAAGAAFGVAPAHANAQDDQFFTIVKDLGVPTNSAEEAGTVGRGVCDAVEKGKIEPARTVRGIINQLRNQAGIDKGQATHVVWGAVKVYCPQYASLVGR